MSRNDDSSGVQLITFGKRSTLDRRHNNGSKTDRGQDIDFDDSWRRSPLYQNGTAESTDTERTAFLPPVTVDPGLDSVGGSAVNHKGTSGTSRLIEEMEKNPPKDRYYVIYMVMMMHGVAILIPWNMFINAKSQSLFRAEEFSSGREWLRHFLFQSSLQLTNILSPSKYFENYKLVSNHSSPALDDYRTNFMSYIGMASQYPNFIMNVINLFVQCGGQGLGLRVVCSIIVIVFMFILTVILAVIDTTAWPETFFWVTMGSVIIINAAEGIYQNSMYGISAVLPMKYTNAIIFGNNMSGTLVAVTNLILLIVSPNIRTAAIYYFVVAIVILMAAFDAYFVTSHSRFYRHYLELKQLKDKEFKERTASTDPAYKLLFKSFGRVFKQIYHLIFGVWFTFFITLALFPAVMSDVKPVSIDLRNDFWTGIVCFLCFNLFATLGNLTTEFIRWPSARWVNILILLRVGFVPLMILGNFRPDLRTLPIYIANDYVFIASAILFSFTSGYCSSLVMMYAPKCVAPNDSAIAGMTMALFLAFGILCGINFSRVWGIIIGSE